MSYILTSLAKKKIQGWNEIALNYDDGERLCHELGVRLLHEEIQSRGEYTVYKKIPFIILRKNLKPKWKSWVIWHELSHHFLHYPGTYLFTASSARKADFEANYVASIALLPTEIVQQFSATEIIEEYGYPKELIKVRKLIYDNYLI